MNASKSPFREFVLPDHYVQFSPVSAETVLHQHGRLLGLDINFLKSLTGHLGKKFGPKSEQALYDIGYQWGLAIYQDIEKLALGLHPGVQSIKDLNMNQFHRMFTNHLAAIGWGNFELKRRDDFLFVDLHESIFVAMQKALDEKPGAHTICPMYAGFFAGIFSRISNMDLACIEITCACDGYEHCSFVLDNRDTILAIKSRIKNNVTPLAAFEQVKREYQTA